MTKLLKKVQSLGWFGGELKIEIGIQRTFEGYFGRASEDWETQYTFRSNQITSDTGNILFPALYMESERFEEFDRFISKVEEKL